jgi:hypothetical protein
MLKQLSLKDIEKTYLSKSDYSNQAFKTISKILVPYWNPFLEIQPKNLPK